MIKTISLIILIISCSCWAQTNKKLSINLDTVIDENISEFSTKQSEYLHNKTTSLFSQEGFEINDTGFATIIPKLSKISNIESDDIYAKTMIVRLSLNIIVKSNSITIASYDDELAGSGATINEATLSAIDKLGELKKKEQFGKFIQSISNNYIATKRKNEKEEEERKKQQTENPGPPDNYDPPIPKKTFLDKFWEWINNFNNLLGVITALIIIFTAFWSIRKKFKVNSNN